MLCNSCYSNCCTCCTPSNCIPVPTTTTTTTTTTLCPDPLPCDEAYAMDCIVYSACNDSCSGIKTGDSLTEVFATLFDMLVICDIIPGTTTTLGPLQEICLGYNASSNLAAACAATCTTYYVSQSCHSNITLDCVIYTDLLGTQTAPQGAYSYNSVAGYFVNSGGIVTGVTSCP